MGRLYLALENLSGSKNSMQFTITMQRFNIWPKIDFTLPFLNIKGNIYFYLRQLDLRADPRGGQIYKIIASAPLPPNDYF